MSDTEITTYVCSHCKARYPIGLIVAWDGWLYSFWHAPVAIRYHPISGVWGRGWAAIQGPDHSSSNSIMRTSISRFSLKR